MNKSQIFKSAHEVARAIAEYVGDYKIAFSIALKSTIKKTNAGATQKYFSGWARRLQIKFNLELHGFASVGHNATKSGKPVEEFQFSSIEKFNELKNTIGNMGSYFFVGDEIRAYRYKD